MTFVPAGTESEAEVTQKPPLPDRGGDDSEMTRVFPFPNPPGYDSDVTRVFPSGSPPRPAADVTLVPTNEVTVLPPVSPSRPTSSRDSSNSVTEADLTRVSGITEASPVDATQVPTASQVSSTQRTTGSGKTVGVSPASGHASGATGSSIGRFALKSLHAKGGLGEVFTARDTELNREVAVKRIQSRYADDPASRRRFLTEAEITARLDHPGVVPVFGLVADGFGRPCYAMRFIRGETLKDEIERYHNARKDAGDVKGQPRSVAFRHLLQRFIAVCQAIAYAHTRKVIHRDIKPANVMVGAFGETLVVDWGLAKALDDGHEAEEILKVAAESGFRRDPEATELDEHATLAGTAIGTPSYMAPEQASGRLDVLGPAADIYSLGATLFVILTGKAPFTGSATETLEKVRRGEFVPPRTVNPETPAPLDAVCRKAMALKIEDRYATPLELAADIERWLSDEPVTCYRDPVTARLARWARRHPAQVATAVSLLVAGVLAAGGIAIAVKSGLEQVKKEEKKTKDEIEKVRLEKEAKEAALNDVQMKQAALVKQTQMTELERQDAIAARDATVRAYNVMVFDIQRQLADRTGTHELRRSLLKNAVGGLLELLQKRKSSESGMDRTLVAAYRQMGDVYQFVGNSRSAGMLRRGCAKWPSTSWGVRKSDTPLRTSGPRIRTRR